MRQGVVMENTDFRSSRKSGYNFAKRYDGVLEIDDNYQFLDTGSFSTMVYGGGSNGLLRVNGDLGRNGTMTVVRGPGAYLDGTTYEVLTADSLSGDFTDIVLPKATPLLSFELNEIDQNSYVVTARTEDFATVASNRIDRRIASDQKS